jgi:hypothetical protein
VGPVFSLRSGLLNMTTTIFENTLGDEYATASVGSTDAFLKAYTSVARANRTPWLTVEAAAALKNTAPDVDFTLWSRHDALRALLLLKRAERLGDQACTDAATACFAAGDASEQESWLRAVALLPAPAQFTPLVIDGCRTNILPVFRAIALGNPFAARHFPELNFNQMVLKALFNGVPLAGIVGLQERRNAELARMAGDYAAERRAAARTVPEDIGLAL